MLCETDLRLLSYDITHAHGFDKAAAQLRTLTASSFRQQRKRDQCVLKHAPDFPLSGNNTLCLNVSKSGSGVCQAAKFTF